MCQIAPSLITGASRGEIVILAEEVQDSKYTIQMQLSAGHLDKKDFFGKVLYVYMWVNCYCAFWIPEVGALQIHILHIIMFVVHLCISALRKSTY